MDTKNICYEFPVLLKNDEVVDEGVFNIWKIIKKLVF